MNFLRLVIACLWLLAASQAALGAPFVPARDAQCVAFSADGTLVATGISGLSNEEFPPAPHPSPRKAGVVQVWSVESGKRLRRFETFGDLTRVAFSPDGKLVAASRLFATADGVELNEVRVWDIASGRVAFVCDRCHGFNFAPQGNSLAVVSRRRCVVYDLDDGRKLQHLPPLAGAWSIQYSPDGTQLAGVVATDRGCEIRLCSMSEGTTQAASDTMSDPFYTVIFSADGALLASGHPYGCVRLWRARTLEPLSRFPSGGRGIQHPFFSPDGLLLGAGDQGDGDVAFWELASGKQVARYTFEKGALHTYRLRSAAEPFTPERDPARFVFSPDSQSFLAGPHGGILRTIATGQDTRRFGD